MKHAAILNVLLVFAWFTVGLPAAPPMAGPAPGADTELAAEIVTTCIDEAASLPFQPLMWPPGGGPTYCGDPCSPNGSTTGCIDQGSSPWRRTICYCQNGTLVC